MRASAVRKATSFSSSFRRSSDRLPRPWSGGRSSKACRVCSSLEDGRLGGEAGAAGRGASPHGGEPGAAGCLAPQPAAHPAAAAGAHLSSAARCSQTARSCSGIEFQRPPIRSMEGLPGPRPSSRACSAVSRVESARCGRRQGAGGSRQAAGSRRTYAAGSGSSGRIAGAPEARQRSHHPLFTHFS